MSTEQPWYSIDLQFLASRERFYHFMGKTVQMILRYKLTVLVYRKKATSVHLIKQKVLFHYRYM